MWVGVLIRHLIELMSCLELQTTSSNQRHTRPSHEESGFQNGLSEIAIPPPVQNRDDGAATYEHHTLEEARG